MLAHVVGHAAADGSAAVGAPDDQATLDEVAEAEEALPGTAAIVLMKDEIERLDDLVALTDEVVAETKIERLVALVRDELPPAEPVLLFTEYKTTQALRRERPASAVRLRKRHLRSTATTGSTAWSRRRVATGQSTSRANRLPEAFNAGRVRFLVSTEAGGEGIDLQERCAVLVHVDMPWNPTAAPSTRRPAVALWPAPAGHRLHPAEPGHRRGAHLGPAEREAGAGATGDLRGANAASRVLGVGHTLFDIALDEARNLPARVAALDGLPAPVLVLSIEDEVTGTGSLVHRLIFGVTEVDGQPRPMRDWELLKLLNGATLKGAGSEPGRCGTPAAQAATVDRLKNAFESGLADHAPALRRPVCWPEMLFVPGSATSPSVRSVTGNAAAGAG